MKLSILYENAVEKLTDMYYNRLKLVLGNDFPDYSLNRKHEVTSYSGNPPHGWVAQFVHKKYPQLHINIGTRGGTGGLRLSGIGQYSTWSSLKSALLNRAERFDKRVKKVEAKNAKIAHDNAPVIKFLDDRFKNGSATGAENRADLSNESVNIGEYVLERIDHHRRLTYRISRNVTAILSDISFEIPIAFNFSINKQTSVVGSSVSDNYMSYAVGGGGHKVHSFSLSPTKVGLIVSEFLGYWPSAGSMLQRIHYLKDLQTAKDIIKIKFDHEILRRLDDDVVNSLFDYHKYYVWQAINTLLTGSMPDDIEIFNDHTAEVKEENVFMRMGKYFDEKMRDEPFIRKPHYNRNICILVVRSDYGNANITFTQPLSKVIVKIVMPHMNDVNLELTVEEIEKSLDRGDFEDFLHSTIDNIFLESLFHNKSMIVEDEGDYDDFIDNDVAKMARNILKPILDEFPEVTVSRGIKASQLRRYELVVLTKPTEPKKLVLAFGREGYFGQGGAPSLLIGRPGTKYRTINTEDELITNVRAWATSIKPKRLRGPRQPLQPQTPIGSRQPRQPKTPSRYDVDKSQYFPRSVYHLRSKIPGKQISGGESFTLAIHAKNVNFPPEIFDKSNLHSVNRASKHENFIGWIGGTIDGNAMYINEVQSDLMQRTIEMTNQERFNEKNAELIDQSMLDIKQARRELAALKQQQSGSATSRFRLIELIQDKIKEIEDLKMKSGRRYKLSDYSGFKSKVENTFKKWIVAFYHSAFNRARQLGLSDIYIISSNKVRKLWNRYGDDDTSIYARAYDNMASQLGAVLDGDWWYIRLDDIPFSESVHRSKVISEGVDREILEQWLNHAGITIDSIKGNFPDIDFDHLGMIVTKIADGEARIIQDYHDLSPNDLHRALSFIQREDLDLPIEANQYEIEELERDASLLITAYKIVDGVPYGLAFYSLDNPNEPRYDSDEYEEDGFDHLSDSDLFGDEDELRRLWDQFGQN